MLKTVTYTGNVVIFKKSILSNNIDTTFIKNEKDNITNIEYNKLQKTIKIYFATGRVLLGKGISNHSSWLKRHFKLVL